MGEGPSQWVPGQTYEEHVNSDKERRRSLSALIIGSFHPQSRKELTRGVQPHETAAVPPAPPQPSPLLAGESPILTSHHRQGGSRSFNSQTSAPAPTHLNPASLPIPSNPKVPSAPHLPELGHPPPPKWAAKISEVATHTGHCAVFMGRDQSSGAEGKSHSELHPPPCLVSQEAA